MAYGAGDMTTGELFAPSDMLFALLPAMPPKVGDIEYTVSPPGPVRGNPVASSMGNGVICP